MSYYRDTYLKSGHWQSLRSARLDHSNCQCSICGEISAKNDVHHIDYAGSLWVVSVSDLRVLCRSCHNRVHEYERTHPDTANLPPKQKWKAIFSAVSSPICAEKRSQKKQRRSAHRAQFMEMWSLVFDVCGKSHATIRLLIDYLEKQVEKQRAGLELTRAHNEPGLEKEYRNSISAWLQNSSLSERSRVKLQDEIRRRRNRGLKVVAYRCEATDTGNVLVEIDTLKKRPSKSAIKRAVFEQYLPKLLDCAAGAAK